MTDRQAAEALERLLNRAIARRDGNSTRSIASSSLMTEKPCRRRRSGGLAQKKTCVPMEMSHCRWFAHARSRVQMNLRRVVGLKEDPAAKAERLRAEIASEMEAARAADERVAAIAAEIDAAILAEKNGVSTFSNARVSFRSG